MQVNSKIQWLENSQIDKKRWDEVVAQSESVNLYCYSWYLDVVSDNWGALVYGDYEFIMPIPFTIKKGQEILYQPFFSQQLNILGKSLPTVEIINSFILSIPKKFKLAQFNFLNYLVQETNEFEIEEVVFQFLDVNKNYDEINAGYSTNTKRQLKKAVKNDLQLVELNSPAKLVEMFKETVGEKLNFNSDNYSRLENLMQTGLDNKMGSLFAVKQEEEIASVGYFFIQNHRITYLKGASTKSGRDIGAMFFLMDEVIKKYANTNRIFDFGGSKITSVAEFYKKFGGKDEVYLSFSRNNLPWVLKQTKNLRDKLKK